MIFIYFHVQEIDQFFVGTLKMRKEQQIKLKAWEVLTVFQLLHKIIINFYQLDRKEKLLTGILENPSQKEFYQVVHIKMKVMNYFQFAFLIIANTLLQEVLLEQLEFMITTVANSLQSVRLILIVLPQLSLLQMISRSLVQEEMA